MKERLHRTFSAARTIALGGVLFLLPMVVVGVLLGYAYQTAVAIYHQLRPWIPLNSTTAIALVFCLVVASLTLACFAAGFLARRAIGRQFTRTIEQHLIRVYPKYAIYKDLLAGQLAGDGDLPSLRPVVVRKEGLLLPAFAADRLASGLVVVYFPGAPDAWNGSVALVPADRVQPIAVPFAGMLEICERMGRDSSAAWNDLPLSAGGEDSRAAPRAPRPEVDDPST